MLVLVAVDTAVVAVGTAVVAVGTAVVAADTTVVAMVLACFGGCGHCSSMGLWV